MSRRKTFAQTLTPPVPAPNPDWLWLLPSDKDILNTIGPAGWLTAGMLARRLGVPLGLRLRVALEVLTGRKILKKRGDGYAVNLPADE